MGVATQVADPSTDELPRVGILEIGRRIKLARDAVGLSQAQLADAIGVHVNTIGKVERGTAVPDAELLLNVGRVTKVAPEWLLVGGENRTGAELATASDYADLVLIPAYSVRASAGNGNHINDEDVVGKFAFKRSWLARKGMNPTNLVVVSAKGDSMEPTARDGDILLVDRNIARLAGDGIYLIERDNDLYCKRLQKRFDGGVTIMSDNPRYEPQHLSADAASVLNVTGRVVWIGGER